MYSLHLNSSPQAHLHCNTSCAKVLNRLGLGLTELFEHCNVCTYPLTIPLIAQKSLILETEHLNYFAKLVMS